MDRVRAFAGVVVMTAVVLGGGVKGFAQIDHTIDENQTSSGQNHDSLDLIFIQNALKGGMLQVQLGQLALQKSSNDKVKRFAQKMIDDHERLDDALKPVAQKHGAEIPSGINKKDQKTIDKLSALSGDAFDQAYLKETVKEHKTLAFEYHDEYASIKNAANVDPNLGQSVLDGGHTIDENVKIAEQVAKDQNVK